MKKSNIKTADYARRVKPLYMLTMLLMFHLIVKSSFAKTNPISKERAIAFKRAATLNNGISFSWLEQTWNSSALQHKPFSNADFVLLKKLGFKSIRLPIAFEYYKAKRVSVKQLLRYIDTVLAQCKHYGFKLVIDYHAGKINDVNYQDATKEAISTWQQLSAHFLGESADVLFFEIYNEPPHMSPQRWHDAAYNIVTAIRKIDKQRTLLVGASNFNSIYELSRTVKFADENIIYTFHFYEPFFFTHQGAPWVGNQVSTTGVAFPYDGKNFPQLNPKAKGTWGQTNYYQYRRDGNKQSVKDKLQIIKNWSGKYFVPLLCSEYGVYKQADANSRCRYIKTVRSSLRQLNIPGMIWDYNTNFSIFDGRLSASHLSPCMHDALMDN